MVMVLLFLGVVFLLVGFQAMGSGDDDGDQSPIATTTDHHHLASPSASPEPAKARRAGVQHLGSGRRRRRHGQPACGRPAGTSPRPGNLTLPDVAVNTVYFSDAPGEREAADEVGRLLEAPVQPRLPELAEQPPGVVVVVTG